MDKIYFLKYFNNMGHPFFKLRCKSGALVIYTKVPQVIHLKMRNVQYRFIDRKFAMLILRC